MHGIPKGYLVTKKIAGKEYLYLQYTAQGKRKASMSGKRIRPVSGLLLLVGSLQRKN